MLCKIHTKCSSVTHAHLRWFENTKKERAKKEAPVQKSSAITNTYV